MKWSSFILSPFARRGFLMIRGWLSAAVLGSLLLFLPACSSRPGKSAEARKPVDEPAGPPLFEDVTAAAGLSCTYHNGEESADHRAILESLGGGVALLDYDGDGLLDVFV